MAEPDGPRAPRPRRLSRAALQRLNQPLDPELVSERTTEDGVLLRYLEGWRVIEQANAIFGHDRWGAELVGEVVYRALRPSSRARNATAGFYAATVRVTVDGCLPHSDVGTAVVAEQTAEGHAVAYKAAVTDGLKRALRHLSGDRFGNGLSAGLDDSTLPELVTPSEELRRQVLEIAASAGSDETRTREWIAQRYGRPLDELEGRPLANALTALSRGVKRRVEHMEAA